VIVRPLLVAHRAGNDLARLVRAERDGADLVELDVHLRRGRLEVRHLKRLGPLPLYWDRWELRRDPRTPLRLEDVLEAAQPETALMLDLKGFDPRMAGAVSRALGGRESSRRITVCGRDWRSIDAVGARTDARRIYSAGDRLQLARLLRRVTRRTPPDGASLHQRLLDRASVGRLRDTLALLMSWPVSTMGEAERLAGLGVDGLICGSEGLLREIGRRSMPEGAA
jgi:glycerophosphoryl diester phosphodiesterase